MDTQFYQDDTNSTGQHISADDLMAKLVSTIWELVSEIRNDCASLRAFSRAELQLDGVLIPTGSYSVARNRLNNARSYWTQREPKAAAYELTMLARTLNGTIRHRSR